jgi:CheY-like chemotaxis protein
MRFPKERAQVDLMLERGPYCPLPAVLVVENNVLERMSKAADLRRQGLEVFEAADMTEAITILKTIAVDILISDVSLIDGTALARWVQERQPTTQVVWTSALRSGQNCRTPVVLH